MAPSLNILSLMGSMFFLEHGHFTSTTRQIFETPLFCIDGGEFMEKPIDYCSDSVTLFMRL